MSDSTPAHIYRFGRFQLDMAERQLRQDGNPVDVNGRYLDALALLAQEGGKLVSKDRFMDEVWRGIPVTDEALTQCIRSLRKQLGDDAARPQFIETVPKYGYRFIAAVESKGESGGIPSETAQLSSHDWSQFLLLGWAGTVGGGIAGLIGGLAYGLIGMTRPDGGAASALLVLACIGVLLGTAGGTGVGFGISAARFARNHPVQWTVFGGATGGFLIGALAKLIGPDAFNLLIGQSPASITGPMEGVLLGAATAIAYWINARRDATILSLATLGVAAAIGAAAGIIIILLGGQLMLGSLDELTQAFPQSQFSVGHLGGIFGESHFGLVSRTVTAAFEGLVFVICTTTAMLIARRDLKNRSAR